MYNNLMQLSLWKRVIFYGLALWLIVFAVISLLVLLNLTNRSIPTDFVLFLAAFLLCWTFSSRLHLVSMSQGLLVGLAWLAINMLLDYTVIVRGFNGGDSAFYQTWIIWGHYVLMLIVPIIASSRRQVTPL